MTTRPLSPRLLGDTVSPMTLRPQRYFNESELNEDTLETF